MMEKMSALSLQVTYRKGEPFAAYISLALHTGDEVARTEEALPDLLVDYASDGRPLGIEIVTPRAVSLEAINEVFDRLGLGRPDPADLRPLQAA